MLLEVGEVLPDVPILKANTLKVTSHVAWSLLACSFIAYCCFSGNDACLSLQTSIKHTAVDKSGQNGLNLPCRHPEVVVNKMCRQSDPGKASVCILHLVECSLSQRNYAQSWWGQQNMHPHFNCFSGSPVRQQ